MLVCEVVNPPLPSLHHPREMDPLHKKAVSKVVVRKVGSGLRQIGKQMVLKPSVVTGGEDDHSLYDIDEADDISLLMVSGAPLPCHPPPRQLESRAPDDTAQPQQTTPSHVFLVAMVSVAVQSDDGSGAMGQGMSGLEGLTSSFRDLSAWRVCIPRVEQRVDAANKPYYAFIVDVTRIDVSGVEHLDELHWEVERRYNEFYILENKLTEFHGEFQDNQLPPKRALFTSKDIGFMQTRRLVSVLAGEGTLVVVVVIFEEFLQKLLQKPALKGSQLLFLFLKTKDEFTNTYLPDVSLGRLIRDVPRKLMKERGQYLDAFINMFLSSTVTAATPTLVKSKSKVEWDEPFMSKEQEEEKPNQLFTTLFGDNAQSLDIPLQEAAPPPPALMNVVGVFDTVLYLVVRVYGLSRNALRWLMCVRVMAKSTLDAAVSWFLRRKLAQALAPPRIVTLIHLIRGKYALFIDPPEERGEREHRSRERELRREVVGLLSPWLQRTLFTQDLYNEGANTLVTLFQHPVLNKQLSYVLLDGVLDELFPELAITPELSPFLSNS
ncbi:Sorting nexin-14 [Portunus trituberculatus]|uniref:Sorting nexin-14 n=1 Tax=Portunus trituberculatus TaxID=210409 RepID=A0A5B7E9J7_PORTR|nr:Sorting nexin-14 [Portunus trituberculatus]